MRFPRWSLGWAAAFLLRVGMRRLWWAFFLWRWVWPSFLGMGVGFLLGGGGRVAFLLRLGMNVKETGRDERNDNN